MTEEMKAQGRYSDEERCFGERKYKKEGRKKLGRQKKYWMVSFHSGEKDTILGRENKG